ncbi:hypothetical protein OG21DRAFT_1480302 [Imleria badia]|nr:hypothetical protein OG21DRAFT_1480302 [Imleria badia]
MVAGEEMATQEGFCGSIAGYATRFVDPAFGWNYLMKYLVAPTSNMNAAREVMHYWTRKSISTLLVVSPSFTAMSISFERMGLVALLIKIFRTKILDERPPRLVSYFWVLSLISVATPCITALDVDDGGPQRPYG